MKQVLLTYLLSCILATTVQAQVPYPAIDTTHKKPQSKDYLRNTLPQDNFSHKTPKGSIYILPYDNMSCLVPDMSSVAKMPGSYQPLPKNTMPNVIPRRELIPKPNRKKESPY
jgi:hypothetical protein